MYETQERVGILFEADLGQYARQVEQVERDAKRSGETIGREMERGLEQGAERGARAVQSQMTGIGRAIKGFFALELVQAAGRVLGSVTGALRNSAQAASETAKSYLRLSAASELYGIEQKTLNQLSTEGQTRLKLSAGVANELAVGVGKIAGAAGEATRSQELWARALDLGAANGLNAAKVGLALEQSFKGVDEGLNALGLADPGQLYAQFAASIGTTADKLTKAQEQQAILNAIVDAGSKVQGEYERQLEGNIGKLATWEATTRKAKETVGAALIPVIVSLTGKLDGPLAGSVKFITGLLDSMVPALDRVIAKMQQMGVAAARIAPLEMERALRDGRDQIRSLSEEMADDAKRLGLRDPKGPKRQTLTFAQIAAARQRAQNALDKAEAGDPMVASDPASILRLRERVAGYDALQAKMEAYLATRDKVRDTEEALPEARWKAQLQRELDGINREIAAMERLEAAAKEADQTLSAVDAERLKALRFAANDLTPRISGPAPEILTAPTGETPEQIKERENAAKRAASEAEAAAKRVADARRDAQKQLSEYAGQLAVVRQFESAPGRPFVLLEDMPQKLRSATADVIRLDKEIAELRARMETAGGATPEVEQALARQIAAREEAMARAKRIAADPANLVPDDTREATERLRELTAAYDFLAANGMASLKQLPPAAREAVQGTEAALAALRGDETSIELSADDRPLHDAVTRARAQLAAVDAERVRAELGADATPLLNATTAADQALARLDGRTGSVTLGADIAPAEGELGRLESLLADAATRERLVRLGIDVEGLGEASRQTRDALGTVRSRVVVDVADADAALGQLRDSAERAATLGIDTAPAEAAIAELTTRLEAARSAGRVTVTLPDFGPAVTAVGAWDTALRRAGESAGTLAPQFVALVDEARKVEGEIKSLEAAIQGVRDTGGEVPALAVEQLDALRQQRRELALQADHLIPIRDLLAELPDLTAGLFENLKPDQITAVQDALRALTEETRKVEAAELALQAARLANDPRRQAVAEKALASAREALDEKTGGLVTMLEAAGLKGEPLRRVLALIRKEVESVGVETEKAASRWEDWTKVAGQIEGVARGALSIADAMGVLDDNSRQALQGVIDVASAVGKIAANPLDVGAWVQGIGGAVGMVKGVIGDDPALKAMHAERQSALRDLVGALRSLEESILNMSTTEVKADVAQVDRAAAALSGNRDTRSDSGGDRRDALRMLSKQLGLVEGNPLANDQTKLAALNAVQDWARELDAKYGTNLASFVENSDPAGLLQALQKLGPQLREEMGQLGQFGDDVAGVLAGVRFQMDALGTTDAAERLRKTVEALRNAGKSAGDFQDELNALSALDLSTEEGRAERDAVIARMTEDLLRGGANLGDFTAEQLRELILESSRAAPEEGAAVGPEADTRVSDTISRVRFELDALGKTDAVERIRAIVSALQEAGLSFGEFADELAELGTLDLGTEAGRTRQAELIAAIVSRMRDPGADFGALTPDELRGLVLDYAGANVEGGDADDGATQSFQVSRSVTETTARREVGLLTTAVYWLDQIGRMVARIVGHLTGEEVEIPPMAAPVPEATPPASDPAPREALERAVEELKRAGATPPSATPPSPAPAPQPITPTAPPADTTPSIPSTTPEIPPSGLSPHVPPADLKPWAPEEPVVPVSRFQELLAELSSREETGSPDVFGGRDPLSDLMQRFHPNFQPVQVTPPTPEQVGLSRNGEGGVTNVDRSMHVTISPGALGPISVQTPTGGDADEAGRIFGEAAIQQIDEHLARRQREYERAAGYNGTR